MTISDNGDVLFVDDHSENCLPDPNIGNDGYVFSSGLSHGIKSSIVSNTSNLPSDYGTTSAAARRQIESALIRSGDTGFGLGKSRLIVFEFNVNVNLLFMTCKI